MYACVCVSVQIVSWLIDTHDILAHIHTRSHFDWNFIIIVNVDVTHTTTRCWQHLTGLEVYLAHISRIDWIELWWLWTALAVGLRHQKQQSYMVFVAGNSRRMSQHCFNRATSTRIGVWDCNYCASNPIPVSIDFNIDKFNKNMLGNMT